MKRWSKAVGWMYEPGVQRPSAGLSVSQACGTRTTCAITGGLGACLLVSMSCSHPQ